MRNKDVRQQFAEIIREKNRKTAALDEARALIGSMVDERPFRIGFSTGWGAAKGVYEPIVPEADRD
jgi:hypothetical protein